MKQTTFQKHFEQERLERIKCWSGRFAEPLDVVPVYIQHVKPGAICRLWFMPNQSRFVVIGRGKSYMQIVGDDGHVSGFTDDCLVVVLGTPPDGFNSPVAKIQEFENEMFKLAWCERSPKRF